MRLKCICGHTMTDIAHPNSIEHLLLDAYAQEQLENLLDKEVAENGKIDLLSDHFDEVKAIDVWKCNACERLYVNAHGNPEDIIVYSIEQRGVDPDSYIYVFSTPADSIE
jgi:hypothetical protein